MDEMRRARRLTRLMLNTPLVFVALALVLGTLSGTLNWALLVPLVVMGGLFVWLYLRITNAIFEKRYPRREVVAAGAIAVAEALLGGVEPFGWSVLVVCWAGIAVIGVSGRTALAMGAGAFTVSMAAIGINLLAGRGSAGTGLEAGGTLLMSAAVYLVLLASLPPSNRLWVWIWQLAVRAREGQEAKTRLAVAEERLRFSRDLHDLVGHQLSAIAVKTELAVRLAKADPGAATAEMGEVHELTRKALKELRQAVRGYRELDLAAELDSVRSVLEAADVACELHLPYRDPPEGVAPVFAYAVREAVTNVLKHSDATRCDITIRFDDYAASLEVRNDGVLGRPVEDLGSGLTGMAERLAAVGGSASAQADRDGDFVLTAVIPLAPNKAAIRG
ncbi:sensor histidine kinase [Nonomuraea sp. NPDC050556]|uniref:sensor histidine kinase n=1 Tax=Nonomuraea sp. NPDC050556 TaxID=3364369 RepID=UPI0037A52553